MKKIIILFLLVLATFTGAVAEEKPLGVKEYSSVDELAAAITAYFPKVQGEVKTVQGDQVTISLGTKDGLQNGVSLMLWRDGKEILHPVTNAVIGRTEEEIGSMELISAGSTTSTGTIKKKIKDPKPGDKARITPKKISLALLPLNVERPEILQGLAGKLNEYGRFAVLDREKIAAFLKDRKQRDGSLVKEMGRTFTLDVVAAIGIYPSDSKFLVNTTLYYADDARLIDTIVGMLDLKSKGDAFGEVKPFFVPVAEEKAVPIELSFDAQLFVAARLEGDSRLQYVFSDGAKLHIYQQDKTGWHEAWKEPVSYAAGEMQHFNLEAADINGNGRPEIFVTGMLNGRVVSSVIEFRDGVYQRIADVPGFLRVVTSPRTGSVLIGQAYDPMSFFADKPKQYAWADGKYVPGAEYPLPKDVGLYSFTYAELGESKPLLVVLDEKEQLLVYSKGTLIWRSEETYPSVGITVQKPATGVEAMLSKALAESDKSLRVTIRSRLVAMDTNGDGKDEIILPKNSGATFLTGHKEAEFVGLGWTGSRLEPRWSIPETTGAVLDYQVVSQAGAGSQILAVVRTLGGLFASDTLRLMTYSVK